MTKSVAENASPAPIWNAGHYDKSFAFIWEHGSSLVDLLDPEPGERVIDLGCGTGHLTRQIADSGARVIGFDNSLEMIAQARANYPDLQFEVADAIDFDVSPPVDAIFSNAVLHWVRPPERVAACVARALKPGGRFVVEFGGKGNISRLVAAIYAAFAAEGDPDAPGRNPWYFPSVAEYAALLEAHGLQVTYAALFERPTPLDGGAAGLRVWLEMFGAPFLRDLDDALKGRIIARVEEALRPTLFRDGTWYADYRRLRLMAIREPLTGGR